jgi:hypothetical protein
MVWQLIILRLVRWALGGHDLNPCFPEVLEKLLLLSSLCCRRTWTETEKAPKLLGNKFIKQDGSDSVDLSPKAEPREQRGLSLHTI